MKKVYFVCRDEDLGFFYKSILYREDIELVVEHDIFMAVSLVVNAPPDLLLVRERLGESTDAHLQNLARRFPKVPFPVALISEFTSRGAYPEYISGIIPAGIEMGSFNDIIAGLLDLPTRRSPRLPVRLGISLSASSAAFAASTLNVSTTGMLVESPAGLVPGETCSFRFTVNGNGTQLPPVSARILREERNGSHPAGVRRYAMEFSGIPSEAMETMVKSLLR